MAFTQENIGRITLALRNPQRDPAKDQELLTELVAQLGRAGLGNQGSSLFSGRPIPASFQLTEVQAKQLADIVDRATTGLNQDMPRPALLTMVQQVERMGLLLDPAPAAVAAPASQPSHSGRPAAINGPVPSLPVSNDGTAKFGEGVGAGIGSSPDVRRVQELANHLGVTDANGARLRPDGDFGNRTLEAMTEIARRAGALGHQMDPEEIKPADIAFIERHEALLRNPNITPEMAAAARAAAPGTLVGTGHGVPAAPAPAALAPAPAAAPRPPAR